MTRASAGMLESVLKPFGVVDVDVRAYLRYAALRPRLWRVERPDFSPRRPEYLAHLRPTPLQTAPNAPLSWGGRSLSPDKLFDLRLASTRLDRVRLDAIPWDTKFGDAEDEAALHRFAWLLPWMAEQRQAGTSAAAVWNAAASAIRSWAIAHPSPDGGEAWHSYTIAERLVNWIVTAIRTGEMPLEPNMVSAIAAQAEHLAANLEYYGPRFTGNHLSNNGRGLYFAGAATGRADLAAEGREILRQERSRIFSSDGFLREGSSHYQFLATRNYHEVDWLARRVGDTVLIDELAAPLAAMRAACAFFIIGPPDRPAMPLIGDISPDVTPDWLMSVALPSDDGWRAVFPEAPVPAARAQSTTEWARLDAGPWTVFAHANVRGTPIVPGHAHHDTGGIVLFLDGQAAVLECGRRHYVRDGVGDFGLSGWAHSILVVDGLSPEPNDRWFVSREFVRRRAGSPPIQETSGNSLRIEHHGFERSSGVGAYERHVGADARTVTIDDRLEGRGKHRLTLVFHLPNAVLDGDRVTVTAAGRRLALVLPKVASKARVIATGSDGTFGWTAERYGGATAIATVVLDARVRLPWRGVSTITIMN